MKYILITFIGKVWFQIANESSLRNLINWQDISDCQSGLLATIDILSTVHALRGDEVLWLLLEPIRVSEGDLGQGGASARIVDNLLHHSFDVAVALGEIQVTELGFVQTVVVVSFEDTFRVASSLVADYTAHFSINWFINLHRFLFSN